MSTHLKNTLTTYVGFYISIISMKSRLIDHDYNTNRHKNDFIQEIRE
jgi:hypothetical protein